MAEGRREIKGALDAKMVTTAEQMRESLDVIAALEPGFAAAIARVGYPPPRVRTPGYETLLRTIVGQQVSVASAAAVWRKLEAELGEGCAPQALLARDFAAHFHAFLPRLTYPLRVGTHFNIAFALILARDWAQARDDALAALIHDRALHWFAQDRACQAWEPGGDEFLSPALCEALLMSRLIDRTDFAAWFHAFLPDVEAGEPATLFTPATVSDRSDGKIAHLDGLNLSRAWALREIASAIAPHSAVADMRALADRHFAAAEASVAGDYMGEHWLASFALLALLAPC